MQINDLFDKKEETARRLKMCMRDKGFTKNSAARITEIPLSDLEDILTGKMDNYETFKKHIEDLFILLNISADKLFGPEYDEEQYGSLEGIVHTKKDPYDSGFDTTKARTVNFRKGLTVLVGTNGAGKSTMIHFIKDECRKKNVACIAYDNLRDGGSNARSKAGFFGDFNKLACSLFSSEGEELNDNISYFVAEIGSEIRQRYSNVPEIWILLDASDSGLSIDNVIDMKEFFHDTLIPDIEENHSGTNLYIVVAANEYEMCREEPNCLDVISGKYAKDGFPTYDDYRKFILKSKEEKLKRKIK